MRLNGVNEHFLVIVVILAWFLKYVLYALTLLANEIALLDGRLMSRSMSDCCTGLSRSRFAR